MIEEILQNVEVTKAFLPTWLIAAIAVNGTKMIVNALNNDNDADANHNNDRYTDCFSSYKTDKPWIEHCKEINRLYKATPSKYTKNIDFKQLSSIWNRYSGTSNCATYPNIADNFRAEIIRNFKIDSFELVIFIHDITWGKRQKGVCITNNSIYVITNLNDHNQRIVIDWASISQVCYDKGNFFFIGYDENFVSIPANYFNATFIDCEQVANFFSSMAEAAIPDKPLQEISSITTGALYTQLEQEYIDELKACMTESGDIKADDLKILKSLQDILKISDSRAKELVKYINCDLTPSQKNHSTEDYMSEHFKTDREARLNKAVIAFEAEDYTTALRIFNGLSNAESMYYIAYIYDNGLDVDVDKTKAFDMYSKSAELGDSDSQFNLARKYGEGVDVCKDPKKAFYWYESAAKQGHIYSQIYTGLCYENGDGVVENNALALYWYKKAAEQGSEQALYFIGNLYFDIDNYSEALVWYQKAADKGDVDAVNGIGDCYYYKDEDNKENISIALSYYLKAAQGGCQDAINNIGVCYECQENYKLAIEWYQKAADMGDDDAISSIEDCKKAMSSN